MINFKSGLKRSWSRHFLVNMATTAVLTLSFTFVILSLVLIFNMSHFLAVWGDEFILAVYLKDAVTADEKSAIHYAIRDIPDISLVTEVTKAEALKSFETNLKAYGKEVLKAVTSAEENPFPASIRVKINRDRLSVESVQNFANKIQNMPGVEEVSYGQDWVSNYTVAFKIVKGISYLISIVVLGLSLFAIGNSIRASLANRKEEIEVLELVGASQGMIRTPFLLEGAFQGAMAVVFALGISGFGYFLLSQFLNSAPKGFIAELKFLPWYFIILCPMVGAILGAIGSYICVARINTGWAAAGPSDLGAN